MYHHSKLHKKSIQKSKTPLSYEEKIARADNDIKEKEAALKSIKDDLMTIQIGREVESSSAARRSIIVWSR